MKRFLAFVLVASMGALTVGCDNKTSTTKDEKMTKKTEDGKTVDEKKVTVETKVADPDVKKSTTTTTETNK